MNWLITELNNLIPTPIARSSTSRSPWCRSCISPSPDQQPKRTIEPGTCSKYHEKSSPPEDCGACTMDCGSIALAADAISAVRSEEHTSELQSRGHLVCRLLLEKRK